MKPMQRVAVIASRKYSKTLETSEKECIFRISLGVLRDSTLNCIFLVSLMKVGISLI